MHTPTVNKLRYWAAILLFSFALGSIVSGCGGGSNSSNNNSGGVNGSAS